MPSHLCCLLARSGAHRPAEELVAAGLSAFSAARRWPPTSTISLWKAEPANRAMPSASPSSRQTNPAGGRQPVPASQPEVMKDATLALYDDAE
ncbi:hypothetical protein D3C76_1220390 [compost metagenome]